MDFRLNTKQGWNAFSKFQGAGLEDDEVQGLMGAGQGLSGEPARSAAGAMQPAAARQQQPKQRVGDRIQSLIVLIRWLNIMFAGLTWHTRPE